MVKHTITIEIPRLRICSYLSLVVNEKVGLKDDVMAELVDFDGLSAFILLAVGWPSYIRSTAFPCYSNCPSLKLDSSSTSTPSSPACYSSQPLHRDPHLPH